MLHSGGATFKRALPVMMYHIPFVNSTMSGQHIVLNTLLSMLLSGSVTSKRALTVMMYHIHFANSTKNGQNIVLNVSISMLHSGGRHLRGHYQL